MVCASAVSKAILSRSEPASLCNVKELMPVLVDHGMNVMSKQQRHKGKNYKGNNESIHNVVRGGGGGVTKLSLMAKLIACGCISAV